MKYRHYMMAGLLVAAALLFYLQAGCEDNSEPDSWGQADSSGPLKVTPASVDLMDETASFTAQGGAGPYSWKVSDATLGQITETRDNRATYTRAASGTGINLISASDSHGRTASAVINQSGDSFTVLSVTATPSSLSSNRMTSALVATGGVAPYQWSVLEQAFGVIVSVSDDTRSAVYGRSHSGNNVVSVEDSSGNIVTTTITQP
ncbi:MAG: hypothetical protein V2A34_16580 [Lentisphaerota bacterium]